MSPTTATPRRHRGGRPSRGARFNVTARIPRSYEAKLHAWVEYTGESINDYVTALVTEHLDAHEIPEEHGQEAFDLKSA